MNIFSISTFIVNIDYEQETKIKYFKQFRQVFTKDRLIMFMFHITFSVFTPAKLEDHTYYTTD